MENFIKSANDGFLRTYEENWISNNKRSIFSSDNPSLSFFASMVYGFAKHLPYSMDIEQPEYVPADFFNMEPLDVETNNWFRYDDKRTFFNAMINWNDTFRSGMFLQMCVLFQKMLIGQFTHDYELKEADYVNWGIDEMTGDKNYNRKFFETLKSLPMYYQKVNSASTNEERRLLLNEVYAELVKNINSWKFATRVKDANGVHESPPVCPTRLEESVYLLFCWSRVSFTDGISSVIEAIKKEQLKKYKKNKPIGIESSNPSKKR